MNRTLLHRVGRAFVIIATSALSIACADDALGPETAQVNAANPLARSGVCDNLKVEKGHKLAFHTYASGVQIYRWNGSGWSFIAPDALLFADAAGNGMVGTHYAGPTWESTGGSNVRGAVVNRCTPNPDAIDWLLLGATSSEGPGIFHRVTFIQRVNTVGGKAPSYPGSVIGEEARVAYTTEYLFYKAE